MGPYGPLRIHGGVNHGWFWVFSGVTMVLFWIVLLLAIVLLVRAVTGRSRWHARAGAGHTMPAPPAGAATEPGPGPSSAEQVLAERLARGDIDVDDYHRRLAALRQGTVPPPPTTPPAV
jgi:putative membrane protein